MNDVRPSGSEHFVALEIRRLGCVDEVVVLDCPSHYSFEGAGSGSLRMKAEEAHESLLSLDVDGEIVERLNVIHEVNSFQLTPTLGVYAIVARASAGLTQSRQEIWFQTQTTDFAGAWVARHEAGIANPVTGTAGAVVVQSAHRVVTHADVMQVSQRGVGAVDAGRALVLSVTCAGRVTGRTSPTQLSAEKRPLRDSRGDCQVDVFVQPHDQISENSLR